MRKVATLALALLCAVSLSAADMTVDDLLAKNAEAKGGMEKIKAVSGARFSGKLNTQGMEMPFTITAARPDKIRVEFSVQGMTGIQAYDGTNGWMVMPFMGKKDPEAMAGDMLNDIKEQADFDGPFIDYAKKGHKVELLGQEKVEGTDAWKVKLVMKDGAERIVYFDAESFLEIKMEGKRKVQGQEIEGTTTLGNYQEVGGLLFPFSIESGLKGAPTPSMSISWDKVDLNPTVAEDTFTMPKKAEAAPAKQQ